MATLPLSEQQSWFFTAVLGRVVFALAGLRVLTDEYRFRTLVPTVLAAGSRTRLCAAKAVTAFAAGAVLALAMALTFMVVAAAFWHFSSGTGVIAGGPFAWAVVRFVVGGGLWGLVGLAAAGLVNHALPATGAVLAWLLFVEDALRLTSGAALPWLPGQAGLALAVDADVPGATPAVGGAWLAAWAVLLLLPAMSLIRRRDVA